MKNIFINPNISLTKIDIQTHRVGRHNHIPDSEFNPTQLAKGIQVEFDDYYICLAKMENRQESNGEEMISTRLLFEFTPVETNNINAFLKPTDQTIKEHNKVNNIIEFECNSYTTKECMLPLIEHIAEIGNVGHSFEIVVDPESSENKRIFGFDGDGSHQIKNIKVNSVDLKKIIKGKY